MNFPPLSMQAFRRWLLAVGWTTLLGAWPVSAQTPKSEGSDGRPSSYQYPLRTWDQAEQPKRQLGKTRPNPQPPGAASNALQSKLQSIIIPHVAFGQTPLRDAVQYLRQESRRLDPDPDSDARGVNIFLRLPKPLSATDTSIRSILGLPILSVMPPPADQATRITLTLERLPLLEAIKYVAAQAGLKVFVEEYAVAIVPPDALPTAEYDVLPELFGFPPDPSPSSPEGYSGHEKATFVSPWLESRGVSFPSGASVVYLIRRHKLVVRNTQENLDKISVILTSARETPTPAPTNP